MPEQRPIGGRRHTGSRSRAGRSWPQTGAASRPASGRPSPPISTPEPPFPPRTTGTRATYRQLILRGLAPDEAADLTAFLAGFAIGSRPWKLIEVNRILFLRSLGEGGTWGPDDGATSETP